MAVLDVKPVYQRDADDCGRAVYRSLLSYFGLRAPSPKTDPLHGVHPSYLEPLLRAAGLRLTSGEMDVVDLRYHTGRGRPVACLVWHGDVGHWVVVKGVNRGKIYYNCPSTGPQKASADDWDAMWFDRDKTNTIYRGYGVAVWRELPT